jgi:hypothetical protein
MFLNLMKEENIKLNHETKQVALDNNKPASNLIKMPNLKEGSNKFKALKNLSSESDEIEIREAISKKLTSIKMLRKALEIFDAQLVSKIAHLALELPELVAKDLKKLESGAAEDSITLTQHQCACILANFFFANFEIKNEGEKRKFPGNVNFIKYIGTYKIYRALFLSRLVLL